MATLSFKLPPGWISLYGVGTVNGISGIVADNDKWKFAVIDDAWNATAGNPLVGKSVMFFEEDVIVRLINGGQKYTIVEEQKLGGVEVPLP